MRLASILKPGHVLTGDNYFTSLRLSHKLLEEYKIFYFGTIRSFLREIVVPKELKVLTNIPPFYSNFLFSSDNTLIQYVPWKNKSVLLLSSNIHYEKDTANGVKQKPTTILDYTRSFNKSCGLSCISIIIAVKFVLADGHWSRSRALYPNVRRTYLLGLNI